MRHNRRSDANYGQRAIGRGGVRGFGPVLDDPLRSEHGVEHVRARRADPRSGGDRRRSADADAAAAGILELRPIHAEHDGRLASAGMERSVAGARRATRRGGPAPRMRAFGMLLPNETSLRDDPEARALADAA